jgi:uncharacterized membrane protein (DUF2068 family)
MQITINKRSSALIAIVVYKACTALLFAAVSIVLSFSWRNYDSLSAFADEYTWTGNIKILQWLLEKVLSFDAHALQTAGHIAGAYALVLAVAAAGLWYQKFWASVLLLVLLASSIPVEVYELLHGISPGKLIVFLLNVVVFLYLLRETLSHRDRVEI